jgi:hypothetical protein
MTTAFHPRATSAALAKFIAEGDHTNADALVKGCDPPQLRALIEACGELFYGVVRSLAAEVNHVVEHETGDPKPVAITALVLAEMSVDLEEKRLLFLGLDGPPTPTFDRVLQHELIEHPDGDDDDCDSDA